MSAEALQAEAKQFKRTHIDYASFMRGQGQQAQASNRFSQQSTRDPFSRPGMTPLKPQLSGAPARAVCRGWRHASVASQGGQRPRSPPRRRAWRRQQPHLLALSPRRGAHVV